MSYPTTVQILRSVKNKGGRPRNNPLGAPRRSHADGASDDEDGVVIQSQGKGVDRGVGGAEFGFGQEGSARVEKRGKGWKWGFISERQEGLKLGLGPSMMVFPASRKIPQDVEAPSDAQSLEHVRQMCDKYEHLGLDELISAELQSQNNGVGGGYDPFLGKRMIYARHRHAKLGRNMVLFTGGELGNHLHIATLLGDSSKTVANAKLTRFLAGSIAVERYPTSILQIAYSPITSTHREDLHATTLVIRLHSSIIIYRMIPDPAYNPAHLTAGPSSGSPVKLTKIGEVRTKHLGGRRPMDLVMDPQDWGKVMVVDESGGVWGWTWNRVTGMVKGESGMALSMIRAQTTKERNTFHRIASGTQQGTLLVMSTSQATVIDIEDEKFPSTTILSLGVDRHLTALDTTAFSRQAVYTCLVTSREVLWIDETRLDGVPALSWRHEFSEGGLRYLEIAHVPKQDGDCYILSSRTNPTLLVFHLSTHPPLHSLRLPYTISLVAETRLKPLTDFVVVDQHAEKSNSNNAVSMLLTSAADGSIRSAALGQATGEGEDIGDPPRLVWDTELQARATRGFDLGGPAPGGGEDKGQTKYTIMEARWAWLAINKEVVPNDDDPIFSAKGFDRYLRETDAPFEHFVTAAELARDSILPEGEPRCSHILRSLLATQLDPDEITALSSVDLQRDLHLVSQCPIPSQAIDGHLDDSTAFNDLNSIYQALSAAFPLRADTTTSKTRHRRCLDALALDLALSAPVISSEALPVVSAEPAATMDTDDDVLARAAGLTLSDTGPPAIVFGILPPRLPTSSAEKDSDEEADPAAAEDADHPGMEAIQSISVRSLLADWKTGSDPSEYVWKPWIDIGSEDHPPPAKHKPSQLSVTVPTPTSAKTARPIRPLPSSPRPGSPRYNPTPNSSSAAPFFTSAPISDRYAPPVVQSQPLPSKAIPAWSQPAMVKKGSIPFVAPSGFDSRGSSPDPSGPRGSGAGNGSQGVDGIWGAATQVERGPFGGRQGGEKKKKVKKRVGGF